MNPVLAFWFFESGKMHFRQFKKTLHMGLTESDL